MTFKTWSETNPDALTELKPNLGLASWEALNENDKYKIWKHLQIHFFNTEPKNEYSSSRNQYVDFFEFDGDTESQYIKENRVYNSIKVLNEKYKFHSYGALFLKNNTLFNACIDFHNIFMKQNSNVVMEMLSLFCIEIIKEREDLLSYADEQENSIWQWEAFEEFVGDINDVFSQFALNYYLTRLGWTSRQEEKISAEIYEPTIKALSNEKWKEVNQHLADAFKDYNQKTPQGYSSSVTNAISAVQAFLQIVVVGKTGKRDIGELLKEAQRLNLIPNDSFTETIFRDIQGFLMRERQETSNAHRKMEYATEMNARLVLNLSMVFFQHCIQHNS